MESLRKRSMALLVHMKLVDGTARSHRCSIEEMYMLLFCHYPDWIDKTLAVCGRALFE